MFDTATRVIFDCHFYKLLTTVIVEGISSEEVFIVKPKATCHIIQQTSIYASI